MNVSARWACVLLIGWAGFCFAAEDAAPKFKSEEGRAAIRTYEEALRQAERQRAEAVKTARAQYAAALDSALKAAMARQDLEEANRLNEAKKRLEANGEALPAVTVAPVTPVVPAIPAADPALAIVGTWRYPNDSKLTCRPDGTYTVTWREGPPGAWKHLGGRKFLVGKDVYELAEDLNSIPNPKDRKQTIVRVEAKDAAANSAPK